MRRVVLEMSVSCQVRYVQCSRQPLGQRLIRLTEVVESRREVFLLDKTRKTSHLLVVDIVRRLLR